MSKLSFLLNDEDEDIDVITSIPKLNKFKTRKPKTESSNKESVSVPLEDDEIIEDIVIKPKVTFKRKHQSISNLLNKDSSVDDDDDDETKSGNIKEYLKMYSTEDVVNDEKIDEGIIIEGSDIEEEDLSAVDKFEPKSNDNIPSSTDSELERRRHIEQALKETSLNEDEEDEDIPKPYIKGILPKLPNSSDRKEEKKGMDFKHSLLSFEEQFEVMKNKMTSFDNLIIKQREKLKQLQFEHNLLSEKKAQHVHTMTQFLKNSKHNR